MTTKCIVWVRNLNRRRIRATNACALWTLIMPRPWQTTRIVRESIVASRLGRRDTYAVDALRFITAAKDAAPSISDAVSGPHEFCKSNEFNFFFHLSLLASNDDHIMDSDLRSADVDPNENACTFGNITLQIDQQLETSEKCMECKCTIPPMITCTQLTDCTEQ